MDISQLVEFLLRFVLPTAIGAFGMLLGLAIYPWCHKILGARRRRRDQPTDRVDTGNSSPFGDIGAVFDAWEKDPPPPWLRRELASFPRAWKPLGPMSVRRWAFYQAAVMRREDSPQAGFVMGFAAGFTCATLGEDPEANDGRQLVFASGEHLRELNEQIDDLERRSRRERGKRP